ncbi:restriction endonuclease [Pseudomonas putida]|uniref:Restriction endonuclease n=1 Tax=Pseudomonas putida TaxID=303 RepID=A0A2Z4RKN1_PSEPU|nr:HNH endonuclease [Pseudomonas putida]AWY40818.1 restriction endonuclease [Pseudomonas putida]
MPAVIAENDESKWADETGLLYHFPKQYRAILAEGTAVLYYKGKMTNKAFGNKRLSANPHYFGVARVGSIHADKNSTKGDLFAVIKDFRPFETAIPNKVGGNYLEPIPPKLKDNYWRNGVRAIDQSVFDSICSLAVLKPEEIDDYNLNDHEQEFETTVTGVEGKKITYFGVRYERSPKLRRQAIAIHGVVCNACGFDFEKAYGEHAKGFIHVHHVRPISEFQEDQAVDPATDLITLCANCHAAVHKKPDNLLTVEELKGMLHGRWVFEDLADS